MSPKKGQRTRVIHLEFEKKSREIPPNPLQFITHRGDTPLFSPWNTEEKCEGRPRMAQKKLEISVEEAAREWTDLKSEKMRIENRLDELKKPIEEFLGKQPEKTAELHGWKFTLVATERESFRLSAAKEKIDGRILKPYITLSKFNQIRTSFRGGEET